MVSGMVLTEILITQELELGNPMKQAGGMKTLMAGILYHSGRR